MVVKKLYRLTVNQSRPYGIKEYYEANETVKVYFPAVTDCITKIRSNAQGKTSYEEGSIVHTFLMPEHDVDVSIEYTSNMLNTSDPSENAMELMGAALMTNQMFDAQVNNFGNPTFYENKSPRNFCPECGSLKDRDKEYCSVCEERIKSK